MLDYKNFVDILWTGGERPVEQKIINVIFSESIIKAKDAVIENISVNNKDNGYNNKRKYNNRTYFSKLVLLDSGANISAMSEESSITNIVRDRVVKINGSTGNSEINVLGMSKEFGSMAILLKDLKFDIVSFSDLHSNHQITFINSKGLFVVRRLRSNIFYIFSVEDGLYFANCSRDLSKESLKESIEEFPDIHGRIDDCLGIVESWHTRKDPLMKDKRIENKDEHEFIEDKKLELNALITDTEYARKMMGLNSPVNESLLKQVMGLRATHLALGHVGRAGMIAHVDAHNTAVLNNRENKRSMRSKREVISKEALNEYFRWFGTCTTCAMAKMTADENHWRSPYLPNSVGDVVHVDWSFYTRTLNKCFFISLDDKSGYAYIIHSENKSAKNAELALDIIKSHYFQHKHDINNVYCDNDPAFSDKSFGPLQVFVKNETSGAHNSKIERFNRSWENIIMALKVDLGIPVPDALFHKLLKFACDSFNMRHDDSGTSPYQRFYGKDYNFELLNYSFGDIVIATNNNVVNKNDLKGEPGMIVGRVMSSDNSFEFLNLNTNTISVRAKFIPITITADREKYIDMVKKLDHDLVLEFNVGKHAKIKGQASEANEFSEIEGAREKIDEDIDPATIKRYSKNKTWLIEDIHFHYTKGD